MVAATAKAYDIFSPEVIRTMFLDVQPPERLYRNIFGQPTAMGLYNFSMISVDDPFAILPPVGDLEDAKSMFASEGIEDYKLQDYRGYVDISNKLVNQFKQANNMPGLIQTVRERYMMILREGVENTIEYTTFKALDDKKATLSTSHDWTATGTTADNIIADLVYARRAYSTQTRNKATVAIHNPVAMSEMELRKDISGRMYTGKDTLVTGALGRFSSLEHIEQPGGFTDHEGNTLSMFAPTTANKNLTYIFNPRTVGYPVIFGAPDFTTEDMPSKNGMRIYANFHAGFVYNKDYVSAITV